MRYVGWMTLWQCPHWLRRRIHQGQPQFDLKYLLICSERPLKPYLCELNIHWTKNPTKCSLRVWEFSEHFYWTCHHTQRKIAGRGTCAIFTAATRALRKDLKVFNSHSSSPSEVLSSLSANMALVLTHFGTEDLVCLSSRNRYIHMQSFKCWGKNR